MKMEVDDTACCPVCFEAYEATGENVPRLLPCAHSLCHACVNRLLTIDLESVPAAPNLNLSTVSPVQRSTTGCSMFPAEQIYSEDTEFE